MKSKPTRRELLHGALAATALGSAGGMQVTAAPTEDKSSVTEVAGVKVGHFTDSRRPTGCTVILCEQGAVAGVDVRGAAPGTRETDLLNPVNTVEQIHAILLSGGSAFGLEAATGVVRYLEQKNIGYPVGVARVPIVPAAILFDLGVGDARIRPDAEAGYQAAKAATSSPVEEGNVGAGAGATVGKLFGMGRAMKGGLGTSAIRLNGITVGAIVAANCLGDVIDPGTGKVIAGARTRDGKKLVGAMASILKGEPLPASLGGTATTLGVVATDVALTKPQATKVAQMAHDGFARAINPVHTAMDGDTIFSISTGRSSRAANVTLIGALAAEAVSRALVRAVWAAKAIAGLPCAADLA